jgi:hypothetical protein
MLMGEEGLGIDERRHQKRLNLFQDILLKNCQYKAQGELQEPEFICITIT